MISIPPVTMGSDGNLYGVVYFHSNFDQGYIYRVTTSGGFDILYTYNEAYYDSALVEVTPGVFYGTSNIGIYKITSDGKYSSVPVSNTSGSVSGISFNGALLLASDGRLYGVGKNSQGGIIYSVKPDGSDFTVLYQGFTGADGIIPESPLTPRA